jgi:hypothetical protein|tara:strand:+ start:506 stop:934 length:429 start_codon:yes stop_codon:yes gene_type:complete
MIKYELVCRKCDNVFDSWFAASKEYEKLKKLKHINCHFCGSLKVEKNLMSPNIVNNKEDNSEILKDKKYLKLKNKIREYQKLIKENFKYVGENFANEARSIHYNEKNQSKGIYGKATTKEVKELQEEGIETEIVPWIDNKEN